MNIPQNERINVYFTLLIFNRNITELFAYTTLKCYNLNVEKSIARKDVKVKYFVWKTL